MELGRFIVRGVLLDCYEPSPYDFKDDRGREVKGISRKVELKFGSGRNTTAEVSVSEILHGALQKLPALSEVECACSLTVRDNALRVQIEDVRLSDSSRRPNHLPAPAAVQANKAS